MLSVTTLAWCEHTCDFCWWPSNSYWWRYWDWLPTYIMEGNVKFPSEVSKNKDVLFLHLEPLAYSRGWPTVVCYLFLCRLPAKNGSHFFKWLGGKNEKKSNTLWHMKITWHSNFSVNKWNSVGARPWLLSQCGSRVGWWLMTETVCGPERPRRLLSGPFRGKVCWPLP